MSGRPGGKGKLGPNGWEVVTKAKPTKGTVQEINAANNKLIKENSALRDELTDKADEITRLMAELEVARENGPDSTQRDEDIRLALELLEPSNDESWTEEGLPRVEVICGLMNDDTVTREEIEAALPGFVREVKPS